MHGLRNPMYGLRITSTQTMGAWLVQEHCTGAPIPRSLGHDGRFNCAMTPFSSAEDLLYAVTECFRRRDMNQNPGPDCGCPAGTLIPRWKDAAIPHLTMVRIQSILLFGEGGHDRWYLARNLGGSSVEYFNGADWSTAPTPALRTVALQRFAWLVQSEVYWCNGVVRKVRY